MVLDLLWVQEVQKAQEVLLFLLLLNQEVRLVQEALVLCCLDQLNLLVRLDR